MVEGEGHHGLQVWNGPASVFEKAREAAKIVQYRERPLLDELERFRQQVESERRSVAVEKQAAPQPSREVISRSK